MIAATPPVPALLPTAFFAMPTPGVPVAPVFRCVEGDHHFVALTRTDVVIAARAAVSLDRFVGLHVANFDGVGTHRLSEQRPGHQCRGDRDSDQHEQQVAAMLHSATKRVHSHARDRRPVGWVRK